MRDTGWKWETHVDCYWVPKFGGFKFQIKPFPYKYASENGNSAFRSHSLHLLSIRAFALWLNVRLTLFMELFRSISKCHPLNEVRLTRVNSNDRSFISYQPYRLYCTPTVRHICVKYSSKSTGRQHTNGHVSNWYLLYAQDCDRTVSLKMRDMSLKMRDMSLKMRDTSLKIRTCPSKWETNERRVPQNKRQVLNFERQGLKIGDIRETCHHFLETNERPMDDVHINLETEKRHWIGT